MSVADGITIVAFFGMVICAKSRGAAMPALILGAVFIVAGVFTGPGEWLLNALIHLHVSASTAATSAGSR